MEEDLINEINTFAEINWKDPFLEKEKQEAAKKASSGRSSSKISSKLGNKKKPAKLAEAEIDDVVYDESKFNKSTPPVLVYIPTKSLMLKMMRVCSECKDPIDLYYIF